MDLQISGTVHQILEEQSGESKNGPWRKRDFILETPGKYPRKVCITQWGDAIDKNNVQKGEQITAYIDIQSREYNGNWYTDVKAWKIDRGTGSDENKGMDSPGMGNRTFTTESGSNDIQLDDIDDDLPF